MRIKTGLSVLLENKLFTHKKIGILSNQASINGNGIHNVKLLIDNGYSIVKIFVPEHGLWGTYGGGEEVENKIDEKYKIPIISLYDEKNLFDKGAFDDIDVFIYDIQDIGSRFYTYIATLKGVMEFFQRNEIKKKIVVLDRPAYLGDKVQGTLPHKLNFLSCEYIPIRYGLTVGEFAKFVIKKNQWDIDLEIVNMKNYTIKSLFSQLNFPFIPPSSAIKSFDTAFFYTGTCLLEGTSLSEGRGTLTPFLIFGEPDLPNIEVDFPGVQMKKVDFKPKYNKHKNKICQGYQIKEIDYDIAHPFRDIVLFLMKVYKKKRFEFKEFHFDRLAGGEFLRKMIINYQKDEFLARLESDEEKFRNNRTKY
ncbi:DUF1343 domain-containing protein [bacterium]|nr:DUF1343 domain-containing protein [bacterium]